MGLSLYEASAAARAVFEMADSIRPGTSAQCFHALKEELSQTVNTQPCVFTVDLAAARALKENGIEPYAVAGFSLGEIAALTFSGALSDSDGFKLVTKRAAFMQEDSGRVLSGMAAILKLDAAFIEELSKVFEGVYPVNYNCPGQVVVAGEKTALEAFMKKVSEEGGKAIPLSVSGGFHSPLMTGAADKLFTELSSYTFHSPKYPVLSNLTAEPYEKAFAETLAQQAKSPVLWQKTIEALLLNGVDTFIEVGPGKTLGGFVKKIAPQSAKVYSVQDAESLKETLDALNAGG
jgi:[acyl-carrier-protein] S-malonyltransferase